MAKEVKFRNNRPGSGCRAGTIYIYTYRSLEYERGF